MPTPARFRTACVARLWDGTRYADARARARMRADAEAFVQDVAADREYPEDLVVARVTRYRPDGTEVGAVVAGDALLHDLTAFVLRLSRRDPPDAASRGGAMPAAAVARALGVAPRTLARFRSSGLVMHHVRDASGRLRTACFPDSLEAFRARHAVRVDRAARTTRLDADARERMVRWALDACDGPRVPTLHALARRLATDFGCSVRTARTVLERDPRVMHAVRGTTRGATRPELRHVAARAHAFGVAPATLARRFGVTESAAARAMVRGRVEGLRSALAGLRLEPLPIFTLPDADATILAPDVVRRGLPVGPVATPEPADPRRRPGRDGADVALVIASWFLAWRASEALRALGADPPAGEVDEIERDLRWSHRLRRASVERALPAALVPCVQRLGRSWAEVPRPLRMRWTAFAAAETGRALGFGAGSSVAIESIRPGALAARAVERAIARGGPEFAPPHGDGGDALEDSVRRCVPWWHAVCPGDGWMPAPEQASDPCARAIVLRFGLDGAPPRTFVEIARELRTSTSRAVATWYRAMRERR